MCYRKAILYRPIYPDAYFNLGNLVRTVSFQCLKAGQFWRILSNHVTITRLSSLQYIDQQKTSEAVAAFKTAIILKHDHVGAWMNQALLLDKSGSGDNTDDSNWIRLITT